MKVLHGAVAQGFAVRAVDSRGGRITRGNVTPTSQESYKSKSINNVGLQKLHSGRSTAHFWVGLTACGGSLTKRAVTEGLRKALSPNVPPLAVDVTTCRQRTAMFCWLCRHGEEEKVDTVFSFSARYPHGPHVSKWNLDQMSAHIVCRWKPRKVHSPRQVKIFILRLGRRTGRC